MRVRELHEDFPWTTGQTDSRSKGLHLTGVIKHMDEEMRNTQGGVIDDATRMQFEKGYLWEVALSRAFAEKAPDRPGEVMLDGIAMSPDGIAACRDGDDRPVVEEYKCTARSSSTCPTDMWRWMVQVKGYCKAVGAVRCVFRVLHLSFVPVYRVWEITFTQGELDENWEAVLNAAKTMKGDDQ